MSFLRLVVASCCVLAFASVARSQTPPTCPSTPSTVAVPAAWFSLEFDTDPTTAGVSSFSWSNTDSADTAANQLVHTGLAQLQGYNNVSYINMSATSGPYFGGKTLPATPIGGPSAGSLTSGTYGWSFEVTFKPTARVTWGKIFDIGNSNNNGCHDDIALSWNSDTFGLQGDYCTSGKPATANTPAVSGAESQFFPQFQLTVNTWYHIVLVFQNILQPNANGGNASQAANYLMYINGQMAPSQGSGGVYPTAVYRANADLGRSDWSD